ncbi:MAG: indolepyruvate oxidoreductase subunit beta [Clostridiales bacterium]|nr:indolepyruvate oxidoreductase subunit beta [Clostridiales bacterium]
MSKNVLLCGVGGQGTILASKLMAAAAMDKGIHVLSAETIGMAQRGGSVTSHVRMGDNLYSPLIGRGQADIILGFEPGEVVRTLPFLKKGGLVTVSTRPVRPVTGSLTGTDYTGLEMINYIKSKVEHVITVDAVRASADLGSSKVLNVVLLGTAISSGMLDIDKNDIKKAILKKIPTKFQELNLHAIDYMQSHSFR